jgi:hypothetical protein
MPENCAPLPGPNFFCDFENITCFSYVQELLTQQQARQRCAVYGGDLWLPESPERQVCRAACHACQQFRLQAAGQSRPTTRRPSSCLAAARRALLPHHRRPQQLLLLDRGQEGVRLARRLLQHQQHGGAWGVQHRALRALGQLPLPAGLGLRLRVRARRGQLRVRHLHWQPREQSPPRKQQLVPAHKRQQIRVGNLSPYPSKRLAVSVSQP